ncbi:MAG: YtfJ family protein [Polyangia bacterium]
MIFSLAAALLALGQVVPSVTLPDDRGPAHVLPRQGQPLLVLYEDQEAAKTNAATRAIIAAYHDPLGNRAKVDVWPVADLSRWDFWPARGAALRHVQASAEQAHSRILVDWKGACQKAWGLRRGVSTVLIVGADGRVLFMAEGEETPEQHAELEKQLRALGLAPR